MSCPYLISRTTRQRRRRQCRVPTENNTVGHGIAVSLPQNNSPPSM